MTSSTGGASPTTRPTAIDLVAAAGQSVPDLVAPRLHVLFCGINPSLYSAVTGHHFARPGNRFWPTLHGAGFTRRRLAPAEQHAILAMGYGITNVVQRATANAAELSREELGNGARRLIGVVQGLRPRVIAVLGVTAYRQAFERKKAVIGLQGETIGDTRLWVLPNPSGLNASYQLPELIRAYRALKDFANVPR